MGGRYLLKASSYRIVQNFSTHRVSLVPHDRQIDAQLQYHQDLGQNTQIALGIKHSENYGHVAQTRDTAMTFGIDVRF